MKLSITREWTEAMLASGEEPGGVMACSPEFSVAAVGGATLVPVVPHGGLDLEDDTPLPGSACPLDGSCEACE